MGSAPINGPLAPIYIVDDFYSDPDQVRTRALALEYAQTPASHDAFPGLRSTTRWFTRSHLAAFRHLIPAMGFRDRAENGCFQFLPRAAARSCRIHADGFHGWAGVVYLNPRHDGLPGTAFYQHRRSGWKALPPAAEMRKTLKATGTDIRQDFYKDGAHPRLWKQLVSVEMKYNRLVLFQRNLFHKNASAFGTTYGNSRLVQAFFF